MITRRDFLKLSPAALFGCALTPPNQGFNIQSAFAALSDGDVLDIPPGVYYVDDTLKPGAGNYHIIRGNNAIISPVGDFSGKPVVDLSSAKNGRFDNLRVLAAENDTAVAGIYMGRGVADGAGHILNQCTIQGAFSMGAMVNEGAEGYTLNQCNLITENASPAYYVNGPIAGGQHNGCAFRNYSGLQGVKLVEIYETISALNFTQNCYFYVGVNGVAVAVKGTASTGVIDGVRVEGEGAGSLLLSNENSTLYNWSVQRVNYTIASDYMIHSDNRHLYECKFDFIHGGGCNAAKYICVCGGGKVWRCEISGDKADWVTLQDTAQTRMNYLYWHGTPIMYGPNDNIIHVTA